MRSISVVIPVYCSFMYLEKTVVKTLKEMDNDFSTYEIILVDDGSDSKTWEVCKALAQEHSKVRSYRLLKNYGQHTAMYCGLLHAKYDYIVTIDDDLQNPPSEIIKLFDKAEEGYEVVFGKFTEKKHSTYRRLGSRFVAWLNTTIFGKPKDLTLSNFRLLNRVVVDRFRNDLELEPYLQGILLRYSCSFANVIVNHDRRIEGDSTYSVMKILTLISRILFCYSNYPIRLLSRLGLIISSLGFLSSVFFAINKLTLGSNVDGWTSLAIMISLLCSIIIISQSMLSEYLIKINRKIKLTDPNKVFLVKEYAE